MSAKTALDYYKNISATTGQMLAAAQEQDWNLLAELEKDCAKYRDTLMQVETVRPVGEAFAKVKIAYIKKILDDDRQIRDLVSPWMKKLEGMLNLKRPEPKPVKVSLEQSKKLISNYQTQP